MVIPIGMSIELGFDPLPQLYIGRQRFGNIRPWTRKKDDSIGRAKWGGLKLDFTLGKFRRPVPKIWKKEYWSKEYLVKEPATNPWNSGNHWFVISIPSFPSFFLSLSFIKPGFYFGWKTYTMNHISSQLLNYRTQEYKSGLSGVSICAWGNRSEWGNIYTCFSIGIRGEMVED